MGGWDRGRRWHRRGRGLGAERERDAIHTAADGGRSGRAALKGGCLRDEATGAGGDGDKCTRDIGRWPEGLNRRRCCGCDGEQEELGWGWAHGEDGW